MSPSNEHGTHRPSEFFPNMFLGRDPFGFDEFGRLREERRSLFSDESMKRNGWKEKAGTSSSTRKSEYVFSANGETVKKTIETETVVGEDGVAKTKNGGNSNSPGRARREDGTRRVGAAAELDEQTFGNPVVSYQSESRLADSRHSTRISTMVIFQTTNAKGGGGEKRAEHARSTEEEEKEEEVVMVRNYTSSYNKNKQLNIRYY